MMTDGLGTFIHGVMGIPASVYYSVHHGYAFVWNALCADNQNRQFGVSTNPFQLEAI